MAIDEEVPAAPPAQSGLLAELNLLGRAFKRLLGAQWKLLLAEFGLARSAVWWMLAAGLAATVAGVGFGLSVLALVGVALAKWWGSWLWALLALAVLQLLFLLAASMVFRRCLHWLTLPRSRGHLATLLRDATHPGSIPETEAGAGAGSVGGARSSPPPAADVATAEKVQRP